MSNNDFDFDFTVIGGGSGGYAAARTAHSLGLTTAVIDGAEELGGLCILRGCMPSKTLIESADRQLTLNRASEFGLHAETTAPSIQAIRDRKRRLIADFASYRQGQLEDGRWSLYRGLAAFRDPHTVEILPRDGSASFTVRSRFFCIATGSESNVPPVPGLAEAGFWTSDDILDAETLPASFIVLGGGAIALEMAHYLNAMGRHVTIVQRSAQLLTGLDKECSSVIRAAYKKRGIPSHCGTQLQEVTSSGGLKQVTFKDHHGTLHQLESAEILLATGRRPAVNGLGLDQAQVHLKHGKITVENSMQTSQAHIFAAGDVCSPLDVVHLAIQQGEIAARNARRLMDGDTGTLEQIDYRLRLFGVFSHPQVAAVGQSEEELRHAGVPFLAAEYPFDDHGKSMVMGETEGFVKLLAHRESGEILGGVCVGPHATELIHEIAVAMHFHSTAADLAKVPHYHPTLSEIWTYPAEELAESVGQESPSIALT